VNTLNRALIVLIAALAVPAVLGAQAAPSADAIARALQTRYQGIQDFSADFSQTYRGGVLKTRSNHRGTVAVKKPGKMRWVYTSPDRNELISDGRKIYWYVPEDKQVTVSDVGSESQASTSLMFLTGRGDIARDFTPSFVESATPGALALKLVPRRAEPDYEYLVVTINPSTLQMQALTTRDRQGGENTITFTNMKENRRLPDKTFVFTPPRGVNVLTDGTR
jgi:outer membrane lipoprotein carrier protein